MAYYQNGSGDASTSNAMENSPEVEESGNKKRKRNRTVLSCTNCKSRKIKCSRTIPCEACIRRNVASTCEWHNEDFVPPPQVFALESEVEALRGHFENRIKHLENLLNVQQSGDSAQVAKEAVQQAYSQNNAGRAVPTTTPQGQNTYDLEEADRAALHLEGMTGGDGSGVLPDTKPTFRTGFISPEQFAAASLIIHEVQSGIENNPRLPFLAYFNRHTIVEQVLAYLGTSRIQKSEQMLDFYFNTIGWIFATVHQRGFRREHREFWKLAAQGERNFDLAWLALLLIILATVLQGREELQEPDFTPEDLYQLSKLCLDTTDWRRKPTYRAIQTLFISMFYMNNNNDLPAGSVYLQEAQRACMALGLHQLGDSASTMPPPDPSCPVGSLLAREQAIRIWYDIVVQDWMGLTLGRSPTIHPHGFTTALPRNYTDDDLDEGDYNLPPRPNSEATESLIQTGKAQTAIFVWRCYELGPIPTSESALPAHMEKMLKLERDYMQQVDVHFMTGSVLDPSKVDDWRLSLGVSGVAVRRCRLWRGLMVRGYSDPRFAYATRTCVETSQTVLAMLRRMDELKAPTSAIWFINRHALSSITTIFIDVLHSIDTGVSLAESEHQLQNIPYALALFQRAERSKVKSQQELGRRGRLLIQALLDAREARLRTEGTSRNYGKVLREQRKPGQLN